MLLRLLGLFLVLSVGGSITTSVLGAGQAGPGAGAVGGIHVLLAISQGIILLFAGIIVRLVLKRLDELVVAFQSYKNGHSAETRQGFERLSGVEHSLADLHQRIARIERQADREHEP